MKTEELRKEIIYNYLDDWVTGTWAELEDGTINVYGNVLIRNYPYPKLPVKFNKVSGYFDCSKNKLKTLEGCPDIVGTSFSCHSNLLFSLYGSPIGVGARYYCSNNPGKFSTIGVKKVCEVKEESIYAR